MSAFRVYEGAELGKDGYPSAWHSILKHQVRADAGHRCVRCGHPYRVGEDGVMEPVTDESRRLAHDLGVAQRALDLGLEMTADDLGLFDRADTMKGRRQHWSRCDEQCVHRGPYRTRARPDDSWLEVDADPLFVPASDDVALGYEVEALWRILTVHHLDGVKGNCRWWNLAPLCQRCHLEVQGKVQMARVWPWEHSEWFRPYVAGFYAASYLGEHLTRSEVDDRLDELLALERAA